MEQEIITKDGDNDIKDCFCIVCSKKAYSFLNGNPLCKKHYLEAIEDIESGDEPDYIYMG